MDRPTYEKINREIIRNNEDGFVEDILNFVNNVL